MSRIGKKLITVPKGVKIDVKPDWVDVQGPKGKMRQATPPGITFVARLKSSLRVPTTSPRAPSSSRR